MQRVSSTFVAAAWFGWHAVSTASALALVPRAVPVLEPAFAGPAPAVHLMLALLVALTLPALHDRRAARQRLGEAGLLLVLAGSAALAAGCFLAAGGEGSLAPTGAALALSLLAFGFDRLVLEADEREDDAAFAAALAIAAAAPDRDGRIPAERAVTTAGEEMRP